MDDFELDDVDRGILQLLQRDARNNSASMIAEKLSVAPNTVRNRISRLEDAGVIQGYHPHIDYERAGYQLRVVFVCTVSISDRQEFADEALDIEGVVQVIETLSGRDNLAVEVIGTDSDDISSVGSQLEDIGCVIEDEWFVKNTRMQPFDHFGTEAVEE